MIAMRLVPLLLVVLAASASAAVVDGTNQHRSLLPDGSRIKSFVQTLLANLLSARLEAAAAAAEEKEEEAATVAPVTPDDAGSREIPPVGLGKDPAAIKAEKGAKKEKDGVLQAEGEEEPAKKAKKTKAPTVVPSDFPSLLPSDAPSMVPSDAPSTVPSDAPSLSPSIAPTLALSDPPSNAPSGFIRGFIRCPEENVCTAENVVGDSVGYWMSRSNEDAGTTCETACISRLSVSARKVLRWRCGSTCN